MAATLKGVTYPTSSDNIAPLETHFANLAQTADNAGIMAGREPFTGPAASGSTVDVAIEYGKTFATSPKVIASVEGSTGSSVYAVTILGAPTTTGFTARVYRLNGSSAEALKLVWLVSSYVAI